jgi:hypothetical protein
MARRTAVLWLLLAAGCSSTLEPPSGDPALDLRHADPRIRVQAARAAVDAGRRDLVPALIALLDDDDGSVRLFSNTALRKLSGRDFGFLPHGTLAERRAAVERWRRWASDQGLLSRARPVPEGTGER